MPALPRRGRDETQPTSFQDKLISLFVVADEGVMTVGRLEDLRIVQSGSHARGHLEDLEEKGYLFSDQVGGIQEWEVSDKGRAYVDRHLVAFA